MFFLNSQVCFWFWCYHGTNEATGYKFRIEWQQSARFTRMHSSISLEQEIKCNDTHNLISYILYNVQLYALSFYRSQNVLGWSKFFVLKYRSEEKGSSLCKCSILLGFFMSKKQERLRSELLSEDKITNLLGFLTK